MAALDSEAFPTSLNGIRQNLTGSNFLTSYTMFVFFRPTGKTRWLPRPPIDRNISTSPLKSMNRIQARKQELNVLYQVCLGFFAGRSGKTRRLLHALIGWDMFDFSSETAERNSTKLDRKQDLIVFYQFVFFGPRLKNKMTAWPLICWDIFGFSSEIY